MNKINKGNLETLTSSFPCRMELWTNIPPEAIFKRSLHEQKTSTKASIFCQGFAAALSRIRKPPKSNYLFWDIEGSWHTPLYKNSKGDRRMWTSVETYTLHLLKGGISPPKSKQMSNYEQLGFKSSYLSHPINPLASHLPEYGRATTKG